MLSRDGAFEAIVYNVNLLQDDLSELRLYERVRAMCTVAATRNPHGRLVLYGLVAIPDAIILEHHEDNLSVPQEAGGQGIASCCPDVCGQLAAVTDDGQKFLPAANSSLASQGYGQATMADFCIGIDALTRGWAAGEAYTHDVSAVREVAAELVGRGHRIANPVLRSFMLAQKYLDAPH